MPDPKTQILRNLRFSPDVSTGEPPIDEHMAQMGEDYYPVYDDNGRYVSRGRPDFKFWEQQQAARGTLPVNDAFSEQGQMRPPKFEAMFPPATQPPVTMPPRRK
jgi:hypothetical protein